jgi:hypothetical protein
MTWTFWAALLIAHGAFSHWTKIARWPALVSVFADGLLIAIGLITLELLQGLSAGDILRVGLFFAAFGASGRQLMHGVLRKYGPEPLPPIRFFS